MTTPNKFDPATIHGEHLLLGRWPHYSLAAQDRNGGHSAPRNSPPAPCKIEPVADGSHGVSRIISLDVFAYRFGSLMVNAIFESKISSGDDPSAQTNNGLPFQRALGEAIHGLAPMVKEHILQTPGSVVTYRGRMRVSRDGGWRGKLSGWLLRIGTLSRTMFPETGEDVDFEMQHTVGREADGTLTMTWMRTYRFKKTTRRFDALMRFRPDADGIVDWIGGNGCLFVELCPRVERGAIVVCSRREWLRIWRFRIPIPSFLKGRPHVREWQEPDGTLRICVEIHNTILGRMFGYEGFYRRIDC